MGKQQGSKQVSSRPLSRLQFYFKDTDEFSLSRPTILKAQFFPHSNIPQYSFINQSLKNGGACQFPKPNIQQKQNDCHPTMSKKNQKLKIEKENRSERKGKDKKRTAVQDKKIKLKSASVCSNEQKNLNPNHEFETKYPNEEGKKKQQMSVLEFEKIGIRALVPYSLDKLKEKVQKNNFNSPFRAMDQSS